MLSFFAAGTTVSDFPGRPGGRSSFGWMTRCRAWEASEERSSGPLGKKLQEFGGLPEMDYTRI